VLDQEFYDVVLEIVWCLGEKYFKTFPIELITLDDELTDLERVDFIKMNIQNDKLHTLNNMTQLLKRHHPTLILEFWPSNMSRNGSDPKQLLALLASTGYRISFMNPKTRSIIDTTPETLLDHISNDPNWNTNLYYVHQNH